MRTYIARYTSLMANARSLPICQLDLRPAMVSKALASLADGFIEAECGLIKGFIESQKWWSAFLSEARSEGFELLGAGFFSGAFSHPMLPGMALKIGFKKEDSGAAYTAWCRANQGRAGVPTVHHVERHQWTYSVLLDLYENISLRKLRESGNEAAYERLSSIINHGEAVSSPLTDLDNTASDIRKFFYGIATFDIHTGNVMLDKRGNLVITDPVSYTADDAELSSVDFESLCEEINARKDDVKRQQDIKRGRRKHCKVLYPTRWDRIKLNLKHKRKDKRWAKRRLKEFDAYINKSDNELLVAHREADVKAVEEALPRVRKWRPGPRLCIDFGKIEAQAITHDELLLAAEPPDWRNFGLLPVLHAHGGIIAK